MKSHSDLCPKDHGHENSWLDEGFYINEKQILSVQYCHSISSLSILQFRKLLFYFMFYFYTVQLKLCSKAKCVVLAWASHPSINVSAFCAKGIISKFILMNFSPYFITLARYSRNFSCLMMTILCTFRLFWMHT